MKKKKKVIGLLIVLAVLCVYIYLSLEPVREISRLQVYRGQTNLDYPSKLIDSTKKNVFIIADNNGTEMFDFVAPYYLFTATGKANVSIVAKRKQPVSLHKGFFVLPHYTFSEVDSLAIKPDVIVIPMLTAQGKDEQDPFIVNWIRSSYIPDIKILSVCAGSFTAAATGLYDGKQMTTHPSDMPANQKKYKGPRWVDNITYTKAGNLYSTAGVSNAAEGTLALIRDMFGEETVKQLMTQIHYPHSNINTNHESLRITGTNKMQILKKTIFRKDRRIGILVGEGVDEFMLGAISDSYHRSFPIRINTYTLTDGPVKGKTGLTILPSGKYDDINKLDELHVLTAGVPGVIGKVELIRYMDTSNYIFDITLKRIKELYGDGMATVVKRLLDYN